MAALHQRKLQEGLQLMKEAEKYMKTGWLKWKPDWDSAADRYSKAGTCFKSAKSYDKAVDAFEKAADAHYHVNAFFHAGKALEHAASAMKEMKKLDKAVELIERAGQLYRESGTPDTAALALIRGGKMCEASEPEKAVELYISAGEVNTGEDKTREAVEPYVHAAKLLIRLKKFQRAIEVMKEQMKLYREVENYSMMYKVVLGMVLVQLQESDYVAADNCYKEGFDIPGFGGSEESAAAEKLLECFDQGDAEQLKACTSQPLFKYLDNELAKLARDLRVPGDFVGSSAKSALPKPSKDATPEVTEELVLEPTGSLLEDTRQPHVPEEGEEDDFSGGLC